MKKLQLSYPIDNPIIINQLFGNKDPKYTNMGLPGHNGIDFKAYHGQPVYATHDGYASYQVDNSGGHGVVIITKDLFDYEGQPTYFKSIYWHLCDPLKSPEYKSPIADKSGFVEVRNGELIGYADNTGFSTGNHLHYGLKPCAKGENNWIWFNTEQNNGYNGAINPMPYFDGSTPFTIHNLEQQVNILKKIVDLLTNYFKK